MTNNKPTFATWERATLDRLCDDLWTQNLGLRHALEQQTLNVKALEIALTQAHGDRRDAMRLARESVDDWK